MLEGVHQQRGQAWALKYLQRRENRVTTERWVEWLRGFDERLLASRAPNNELAARMVQLGELGIGEVGEVAHDIGMGLLGRGETNRLLYERLRLSVGVREASPPGEASPLGRSMPFAQRSEGKAIRAASPQCVKAQRTQRKERREMQKPGLTEVMNNTWQGILQVRSHPTTAIVYWHISPDALHTFVLKHDAPSPIVIGETGFLSQGSGGISACVSLKTG